MPAVWSDLDVARRRAARPTRNTVEQITVGPSIDSIARTIAKGKRSRRLPNRLRHHLLPQSFLCQSCQSARVIQFRQNLALAENISVTALAAWRLGIAIREHLTRNSVAPYVPMLYVGRARASRGTTRRVKAWVQSPRAIACRSCWLGLDRVHSLGLSSRLSYSVEPQWPAERASQASTGSKT